MDSFAKLLSANDVGATGSHQAGILVPRADADLLAFFPRLDPGILNPDAWIRCVDDSGEEWRLRYIYYNNRLHGQGTRNEYRLTHLTTFLRRQGAKQGDLLRFTATERPGSYRITLDRSERRETRSAAPPGVVRLSGWRRVH